MFFIVSASRDVGNEDAGKAIDSMSPIQVGKQRTGLPGQFPSFPCRVSSLLFFFLPSS